MASENEKHKKNQTSAELLTCTPIVQDTLVPKVSWTIGVQVNNSAEV